MPGGILRHIDGVTPLVAQWEKATHPAQVRLYRYLDEITSKLLPLPPGPLFLHLHVRALSPDKLLHQYDLENYLTPLFGKRWLDANRFQLVIGTKDTFTACYLLLGFAESTMEVDSHARWHHCSLLTTASASSKEFKERLRQALSRTTDSPLPEGPVEVRIVLRCSSRRNWATLWKPVGDAMGPVLGYSGATSRYHPRDDRITRLELHRIVDESLGNAIETHFWWRSLGTGTPGAA